MISDFVRFLKHLYRVLHFVRGVMLMFLMLLAVCVVVVSRTEGLAVAESSYFVLVTAMTIGYGDVAPVTPGGRGASVMAGVIGVLVCGLVVGAATRALKGAVEEKEQAGR